MKETSNWVQKCIIDQKLLSFEHYFLNEESWIFWEFDLQQISEYSELLSNFNINTEYYDGYMIL